MEREQRIAHTQWTPTHPMDGIKSLGISLKMLGEWVGVQDKEKMHRQSARCLASAQFLATLPDRLNNSLTCAAPAIPVFLGKCSRRDSIAWLRAEPA
jgi:hypothetical protein